MSYHSANLMLLTVHLLTGVFLLCIIDICTCYLYCVFFIRVCCVISIKYDDDDDDDDECSCDFVVGVNGPQGRF